MALRIEALVIAGELDNTQLGWTVGWLELKGIDERLQLKLAGDCHSDLAGWKFRIKRLELDLDRDFNGESQPNFESVSRDQSGHVGDITADQMVKHFEMSNDELIRRVHRGDKPAFTWRKCLYLEWYSNNNGRVVIQSTRLEVERIGKRAFELSEAQMHEQQEKNDQEMTYFLAQLGNTLEHLKDKPE